MTKYALITGGGSGIGRAIALEMARYGYFIYTVGRNIDNLLITQNSYPKQIEAIEADVGTAVGRKVVKQHIKDIKLTYLIHNAGIVEPLAKIGNISLNKWKKLIQTNVEGPLFLTQMLLTNLQEGSRILNISSGAAHNAYPGMLSYCMSKAALHILFKGINVDLKEQGIIAGSFMPGHVDTHMQEVLRHQDNVNLPKVDFYKEIYAGNKLRSPAAVAKTIVKFLQDTSNELFTEKDWRIEEFENMP